MKNFWIVICLAFVIVGCDGKRSGVPKDNSQVFVSVGDRRITALSVSNSVMILARLREISTRKALAPVQFPYWANNTAMKMVPSLLAAERLDMMLVSNGVEQTTQSDETVLARYNQQLKKNCKSLDELANLFGDLSYAFRLQFARESRQEAYFRNDRRFDVADIDVRRYYQSYSNSVASAERFNAAAFSRANVAWSRLNKGEPWSVVARETTDDGRDEDDRASVDFCQHWEDVQLKNSSMPEVASAVAQLKTGEWTKPIETEEGIIIARLNGRNLETGAYDCARILVQLAIIPIEVPKKNLTSYLKIKKRRNYQFSIREDLVEAYPAEFPLGTNFTYKIWTEPKKLRKGFNML